VESGALVGFAVEAFRRQGEEILDSLGRRLAEEADDQSASFDVTDFDVEVNLLGDFQPLGSLCVPMFTLASGISLELMLLT
jgi:hypothetical protein